MLARVASRLGILALSLVVASLVVFAATQLLPGDIARVLLGNGASPEQLAAKRAELGTDRPVVIQYLDWASGLVSGDLGTSWTTGLPVARLVAPRLEVSVSLVVLGLALAAAVALPLGALAALNRRRVSGFLASAAAQVGMAIPAFWAGILLVLIFAVGLRWFPPNGYVPLGRDPAAWARHLVLPVVALGAVQAAVLTRYARSALLDVLREDHYRTARAVGWTRWAALARHGVRNAALPLVTVLGLQVAATIVGAIVVERVFVLPGLGSLLLDAVAQQDLVVVRGVTMLVVCAVLVINTLVEISYPLLDPRLRARGAA